VLQLRLPKGLTQSLDKNRHSFGSSSLGLVADSVISVMTPFAGAFQPEALSFVVKQVQVIDKNQCGKRKKPKSHWRGKLNPQTAEFFVPVFPGWKRFLTGV